ncbi:MAG: hypothetical protein U1A77_03625 [Pirellulales bacterium]
MGMNAEQLRATGTGDWLKQLKNILQLGDEDNRDYGDNPKAEHRSTVAAVKLLLSNLRLGLRKMPDKQTTVDDHDLVIFNAVDRLIRDKVEKSKKNKTLLEAVAKFETELEKEFLKQSQKKNAIDGKWLAKAKESLKALRIEEYTKSLNGKNPDELASILSSTDKEPREKRELCALKMLNSDEGKKTIYDRTDVSINALALLRDPNISEDLLATLNNIAFDTNNFTEYAESLGDQKDEIVAKALKNIMGKPIPKDDTATTEVKTRAVALAGMASAMDPKAFAKVVQEMLKSSDICKKIKKNPKLGGALLSSIDSQSIDDIDLDKAFGEQKQEILGEAMLYLSQKKPLSEGVNGEPPDALDPKLFTRLIQEIPTDVWNNKTATTGVLKGLGARICMELWNAGGFEQTVELIKHGVDTSLATRVTSDVKAGREGFYSGFVQPLEHIIAKYLSEVDKLGTDDEQKWKEGFKPKVEGAKKIFEVLGDDGASLTKWSDVKNSDMIKEFTETPGTIWGFEDVRGPYVQAAHETDQGSRPLRMWELWDAIGLNPLSYGKLLENPEKFAEHQVNEAVKLIQAKKSTRVNYAHIKDLNSFIADFRKSAKALLLEFAAQLPKGTYADIGKTTGVEEGKFVGALACTAGLWLAKEKEEPVYYCLDGVNMEDVTNYKKVKNAAIEDFLSGNGAKRHEEVITMVEIREILKHWDELKDKKGNPVVKFVLKGKILSGEQLEKNIAEWQKAMQKVNRQNPTPAPDFNKFSTELNKVDNKLLKMLVEKAKINKNEADQDGRVILKKHGYLIKLANTRPHVALKYIMSKCEVLSEYELISEDLPEAAGDLINALNGTNNEEIKKAAKKLSKEIEKCHADYHTPLKKALLGDTTSDD